MRRDDLILGSLRVPVEALQELLEYLEARPGLGFDETLYCEHRVIEVMRQLKVVRRLLNNQQRDIRPLTPTPGLFWN